MEDTTISDHKGIMKTHSEMLNSISNDVKEIRMVLIGSELNGHEGIVKDIRDLKGRVKDIEEWKQSTEVIGESSNESEKKNHSRIAVVAAAIAAMAAIWEVLSHSVFAAKK